jgi:membrane fusion protein (multidrug efflux system)
VDQLESLLAVKSAMLKVARETLAKRTITAPFSGELGARQISPGQYVNAGTPLVTLVDKQRVKVRFRIPERQLSLLGQEQPGRLTVAAWPGETFAGVVDLIDPVVDVATRTVEIRLLADNPEQRLRPGMFARVNVVVETRPNALVIPEAALVPSMDEFGVYAVRDGKARLQPVEIGVRLPGQAEIRKGLQADSEFVAGGIQKIVDGMKVVPLPPATNAPVAAN